MTPERTQNRYLIAKVILDLLHAVHGGGLRRRGEPVKIVDVDRVLIAAVVLIGEHEEQAPYCGGHSETTWHVARHRAA